MSITIKWINELKNIDIVIVRPRNELKWFWMIKWMITDQFMNDLKNAEFMIKWVNWNVWSSHGVDFERHNQRQRPASVSAAATRFDGHWKERNATGGTGTTWSHSTRMETNSSGLWPCSLAHLRHHDSSGNLRRPHLLPVWPIASSVIL